MSQLHMYWRIGGQLALALLLGVCLPTLAAGQPLDLAAILQRVAAQSPSIHAAQAGQQAASAQEREACAVWLGKLDTYAQSMLRMLKPPGLRGGVY